MSRDRISQSIRRYEDDDFLSKVDFFLPKIDSCRYVYGLMTEGNKVSGCLIGLTKDPNFEDYEYWNNTDKPDEISDREWNRRGKTWRELDTFEPSFTFTLSSKKTVVYSDSFFGQSPDMIKEIKSRKEFHDLLQKVKKRL